MVIGYEIDSFCYHFADNRKRCSIVPCLKFRCRQYSRYLLRPSSKVSVAAVIFSFFIVKKLPLLYKKYWTHHERKNVYDVSNFLLFNFQQFDFYKARINPCKSQKALCRKDYLLASSIATATATVIPTMGLLPVATAFIYRRLVSSTDISVELFLLFTEW